MGIHSGKTSKAQWQKQIDIIQSKINHLKSQNTRHRETMKVNNSRTGSKSAGEHAKRMIASNKVEIAKLQDQIKSLKAIKARAPKNQLSC